MTSSIMLYYVKSDRATIIDNPFIAQFCYAKNSQAVNKSKGDDSMHCRSFIYNHHERKFEYTSLQTTAKDTFTQVQFHIQY